MSLTPREIVKELDKYIIGQSNAKRAVAIALRNRYRRSKLDKEIREDITPKNIIMKGPTGVGKTEIARRLAKLVKAPFIKIEATKYTEVGYVGRDVESMVRDLVSVSVRMVKDEKMAQVQEKASQTVANKLSKIIYNDLYKKDEFAENPVSQDQVKENYIKGIYDKNIIEVEVAEQPKNPEMFEGGMAISIGNIFDGMFPQKRNKKKLTVQKAREMLVAEESDKLIDNDSVNAEAIRRAEEEGIIFIDEMDKILGKGGSGSGPDVSREGVQRDILPIVEGSTVATKYGNVKTDFILFIAAGAFHVSSIEDMIPELQGRFPIRVELDNLNKFDFKRILTEPKNAITMQYSELLKVDNIDLDFTDDALDAMSEIAEEENDTSENIGARRLHTIMEKLLEEISFDASGDHPLTKVTIDRAYVEKIFGDNHKKHDLKKYIL